MVLDASGAIELLLHTDPGKRLAAILEDEAEIVHVPHLIDLEIAQVLRRYLLRGTLDEEAVADARSALHAALRSGLVALLNGRTAIGALEASDGAGLLDRLIADDHARAGRETLTPDRKMARLADTRRL